MQALHLTILSTQLKILLSVHIEKALLSLLGLGQQHFYVLRSLFTTLLSVAHKCYCYVTATLHCLKIV